MMDPPAYCCVPCEPADRRSAAFDVAKLIDHPVVQSLAEALRSEVAMV